jgi:hypothetical protein
MKKLRAILNFYKSFAIASSLITFICVYFIYKFGIEAFSILTWFKLITGAVIFYFIKDYKNNVFYYYKNMGLSKSVLWISTLSFDFLLYLSLSIIALKIK